MELMTDWIGKNDDLTLGKLLKEVEGQTSLSPGILKESSKRKGNAHIVGITGPPGAGKSTLVNKLCKDLASRGYNIAVVCVDPTSPFTQGALLGDRTRMFELSGLPNVFIKSLATRGNLGGLAPTTSDIVQVLDACGKEIIIIETVGVGQVEFDVLEVADTIALINVPGLGDSLQTLKAGIMEIADLYVINQADRPGADESVKDLKMMVREKKKHGDKWEQPILKTVATKNEGVEELVDQILLHKDFLLESNLWKHKREKRNLKRLQQLMITRLSKEIESSVNRNEVLQRKIEEVKTGNLDPFTLSEEIINLIINQNLGGSNR